MLSYFNTIRAKMLASFFFFLVIILFISLINIWFDIKEARINALLDKLAEVNRDMQASNKLEKGFYENETINPTFYKTGKSAYLLDHRKTIEHIRQNLDTLKRTQGLYAGSRVDSLTRLFNQYETLFEKIVKETKYRGFKDHGLVGKMRQYIHYIEAHQQPLDLAKILMIRRHEKDFIIRRDLRYTTKMDTAVQLLKADIEQNITQSNQRQELLVALNNYAQTFEELVKTDQVIGLNDKTGIKVRLIEISGALDQVILNFNQHIRARAKVLKSQNKWLLSTVMMLGVGVMVFLAFFLTRILSRPIHRLSRSIHTIIQNDFSKEVAFEKVKTNDEIGRLSKDFHLMLKKMHHSIDKVKKSSEEIKRKRDLLLNSINYARKIQGAILPTEEEIQAYFPENFVIYSPMHVVSGDFYWIGKRKKKLFLAVVDCTGHGVPGGFMSMIGTILLNEIIIQHKTFAPAQVLEQLDKEIHLALRQDQNLNNDGMDLSLLMIEKTEEEADKGLPENLENMAVLLEQVQQNLPQNSFKVTFAGAKNSLFYVQENELHEIKGTRRSIGGRKPLHKDVFQDHELLLEPGTNLYFTTDGLLDQHNQARKKYTKKRFVKVINSHREKTMLEQQEALQSDMYEHMGTEPQRDDITVLGIRL
ncbi:SpoIIE family protein phosphatase [uncultured Microscilla sp.]|uniref:SpoIIE family protein phosphatase n=1 Tax=uncultured Microscilla sp. TaxID=432653 RepID=UPI002628B339|nr:SpoIIE family protein phosphatase [uncultured Microscilla sp.]